MLGPHQLDPVVPANVTSGPATTKSKAKKQSPADNLTLQERLDRMQLAAVEDAAEEAGDEKKKGEEDEEQDALSDDDEDVQGDRGAVPHSHFSASAYGRSSLTNNFQLLKKKYRAWFAFGAVMTKRSSN